MIGKNMDNAINIFVIKDDNCYGLHLAFNSIKIQTAVSPINLSLSYKINHENFFG